MIDTTDVAATIAERLTDSPGSAGMRNTTTSQISLSEISAPSGNSETAEKTRPKILALDLSLRATGWCIGARVGTWEPRERGMRRIAHIRSCVLVMIQERQIDLAVIEGYAFSAHASHAHELGELGGVIRMALYDTSAPFVEIPPASLKLFATGKGNANKEAMLAAAIRKLDYAGHSNDEADALWLWTMAHAHYAGTASNAEQRRALAKITWPHIAVRVGETLEPVRAP